VRFIGEFKMQRIFFLILFLLCGCVSSEQMKGLLTLKSLANNQAQQEKFIKTEEAKFQKLLKYVKQDKLKKGRSKKWILAAFGQPHLSRKAKDDSTLEYIMYRHSDKLFGSERVYLYFDKDDTLVDCRYEEGY